LGQDWTLLLSGTFFQKKPLERLVWGIHDRLSSAYSVEKFAFARDA